MINVIKMFVFPEKHNIISGSKEYILNKYLIYSLEHFIIYH